MSEITGTGVERIKETLQELGIPDRVRVFEQTTRTSQDAADAIGCQVEQIAKSIVFKGRDSGKAVLVIASGANRVNEKKLAEYIAEPVKKPDADFVREHTGYAIGGIPPVGHIKRITTYIDEDLMALEEIWGAAGSPNAVFPLTPDELVRITGGVVVDVKKQETGVDMK